MPRRSRNVETASATSATRRQRAEVAAAADHRSEQDPIRTLLVPREVLVATWQALATTARRRVEGTVRWAGPARFASEDIHIVTTVIVPGQIGSAGSFVVPHEAVRRMGGALRDHALMNVAQLHTHPGAWVGHSAWDDAEAYSRRDGALSIVWPQYGELLPSLEMWGVHECQDGRWVQLFREHLARRIQIVDSVLDLRTQFEASRTVSADTTAQHASSSAPADEGGFSGMATGGRTDRAERLTTRPHSQSPLPEAGALLGAREADRRRLNTSDPVHDQVAPGKKAGRRPTRHGTQRNATERSRK